MILLFNSSRDLVSIVIILIVTAGFFSFLLFYRKNKESNNFQVVHTVFDAAVECERFRSLMIKLYEMELIIDQEHFIASSETVYFNLKDIYALYCRHYQAYFPMGGTIPSYAELLNILSEDHGYYGTKNMFFQKAAYRPSVAMKRFPQISPAVQNNIKG
jgi:hypothetical protein